MFENSRDLLNIALGSSILGVSFFLAWAIYYFARLFQQIFKIVKEMRSRLSLLDDLIRTLKEKIEHSTSHIVLIAEGVKKLVEVIKERSEKKEKKEDKK